MNMSLKDNLMKENDLSPGGLDTWSGVGEMGGGVGPVPKHLCRIHVHKYIYKSRSIARLRLKKTLIYANTKLLVFSSYKFFRKYY